MSLHAEVPCYRDLSLSDPIEYEFTGGVVNQAIVLGDVDGDQLNELAIGNNLGTLFVFKETTNKAWKQSKDKLGLIVCIAIADMRRDMGKQLMTVITAEGFIYMFDLNDEDFVVSPLIVQPSLPNAKTMLFIDVDDDERPELVVGYSDRCVRLYKWEPGQPSEMTGRFVPVVRWELEGQVGTIAWQRLADQSIQLLASQAGGVIISLQWDESMQNGVVEGKVEHVLQTHLRNNEAIRPTTEILGLAAGCYAVATFNGQLQLIADGQELWSCHFEQQLFGLAQLDVKSAGRGFLLVASWTGDTFVVDPRPTCNKSHHVARFRFDESVAAFTAGMFGIGGQNVPCIIYVTFTERILLFPNVRLARMTNIGIQDLTREDLTLAEGLCKLQENSKTSRRQCVRELLYGFRTF